MGLLIGIRSAVGRAAQRVVAWGVGTSWQMVVDDGSNVVLARRGPLRFVDLDKIEAMLTSLARDLGAVTIFFQDPMHVSDRHRSGVISQRELLETIGRGPAAGRRYLQITGFDAGNQALFTVYMFSRVRSDDFSVRIDMVGRADGGRLRLAGDLVDANTRPMTWLERRREEPLFGPLGAADEERRQHERAIGRTAARWGVAAGFLSGAVGGLVTALLSR